MTEPPKKKLKQSTLLDTFSCERKNSVPVKKSLDVVTIDSDSDDIIIMNKEDEKKRESPAKGAEKSPVRGRNSPTVTPKKMMKPNKETPGHATATGAEANPGHSKPPASPQSDCSETLRYDEDASPLLFTDSETTDQDDSQNSWKDFGASALAELSAEEATGRGFPSSEMNTTPACAIKLPTLNASPSHVVLFRPHFLPGKPPRPFPDIYRDKWDSEHVRMPCSNENLYPVGGQGGKKELKNRWDLIRTALLDKITSSYDIEEAIIAYNSRYENKWDFSGLHAFFTELLEAEESNYFFTKIFPKMVQLALQLPNICTQPIPLLKKQCPLSLTLSKEQVACLLANAFFCTFPRRNTRQKQSEYSTFPDINFSRLFQGQKSGYCQRKAEKLKCIFNYFKRILTTTPEGSVTFTRKVLTDPPRWDSSVKPLGRLYVSAQGTIEEHGEGMLQVDFANKFLGGGVLGKGLVQEEIRFAVCPEMLITRLFTEALEDNETLVMTGCEQFSSYEGYADTFKWKGNHNDPAASDTWRRKFIEVVAMDALVFRNYADQFRTSALKRELNKAYCAFHEPNVHMKNLSAVATGKWGCGAFGGDPHLKALLQIMAASECGRDVCFFTFQDVTLMNDIHNTHKLLVENDCRVGDCWALILQYANLVAKFKKPKKNLFAYIHETYAGFDSDTDADSSAASKHESDNENFATNTP